MRFPLLLTGLLLVACEATAPSVPADGPYPLARLSLNGASYASNSGLHSTELGVVTDQGGWDELYLRIWTGVMLPAPTEGTALDFQDSTIVYAGIGYFSNARAWILLDSAEVEDGRLVVHFTRGTVEGCGVAAVAIAPVEVAQVPRWDGPMSFVQHDSVMVCD